MDVSELLAQKHNLLAERSAAPDEPELTLTAREFDYRLRKAFADREQNVEKQVRKLLDDHMREVERKNAEAIAEQTRESQAFVERKIVAAFKSREWKDDARRKATTKFVMDQVRTQLRAHSGGDRAGVIDLPALPLRTQRRG